MSTLSRMIPIIDTFEHHLIPDSLGVPQAMQRIEYRKAFGAEPEPCARIVFRYRPLGASPTSACLCVTYDVSNICMQTFCGQTELRPWRRSLTIHRSAGPKCRIPRTALDREIPNEGVKSLELSLRLSPMTRMTKRTRIWRWVLWLVHSLETSV